jgi:hypothetical protein
MSAGVIYFKYRASSPGAMGRAVSPVLHQRSAFRGKREQVVMPAHVVNPLRRVEDFLLRLAHSTYSGWRRTFPDHRFPRPKGIVIGAGMTDHGDTRALELILVIAFF